MRRSTLFTPRVIQPGRCLAKPQFGTFTPAEAADRLDRAGLTQPVTLAQLYARTGDAEVPHTKNPALHAVHISDAEWRQSKPM